MIKFRFYCTKHQRPLVNRGNGRFVSPIYNDPQPDGEGWYYFDLSEFTCPKCLEEDDCSEYWEIQSI